MYRRTLAASWAQQAGELPADKCIEDIFDGGDGWSTKDAQNIPPSLRQHRTPGMEPSDEDEENRRHHHHKRYHSRHNSSSSSKSTSTITRRSAGQDSGRRRAKMEQSPA